MQKIALPVIFLTAVGAALFYVSQEEHGIGTLLLLAAVLLVGQVFTTLPFIFDAKKTRAGTPTAQPDSAASQKIIANQQVIHEDLRTLGETLVKRLGAISERQIELEKTVLATETKIVSSTGDELDELLGKINRSLDERFEGVLDPSDEKKSIEAFRENLNARLNEIDERLDELLNATIFQADGNDLEEDEHHKNKNEHAVAETPKITLAQTPEIKDPSKEQTETLEDFPEDNDTTENLSGKEEDPPLVKQDEFDLGVFPPAHGATLILDAMLGIENKPFLRGNANDLSENAGTPMDFVEIGKWSFDFQPFSEEITVRILRNDDENDLLGEAITLAPGQNLELAYIPERA